MLYVLWPAVSVVFWAKNFKSALKDIQKRIPVDESAIVVYYTLVSATAGLPGSQYHGSEPLPPPNSVAPDGSFLLVRTVTRGKVQRSASKNDRKDCWKLVDDNYERKRRENLYALLGCGLVATWKTRPDAVSYSGRLLEYCNDFYKCSQLVRNRQTNANITRKLSKDEIQYKNFGHSIGKRAYYSV